MIWAVGIWVTSVLMAPSAFISGDMLAIGFNTMNVIMLTGVLIVTVKYRKGARMNYRRKYRPGGFDRHAVIQYPFDRQDRPPPLLGGYFDELGDGGVGLRAFDGPFGLYFHRIWSGVVLISLIWFYLPEW